MTNGDYKRALEGAKKDLEEVLRQRAELDKRAAELKKTIEGLAALCGETDFLGKTLPLVSLLPGTGISNSIRAILIESATPLSPTQIRDALRERGWNPDEYASHMAVIHNTLHRLVKQGEIELVGDLDFGGGYRRKARPTPKLNIRKKWL